MNDRYYSMLGLAQRAGKVVSGSFRVEHEILSGRARLVILSEDMGQAIEKKITDCCRSRNVRFVKTGGREALSHAVGKEDRSCFAVTDDGFAAVLLKLLSPDSAQ